MKLFIKNLGKTYGIQFSLLVLLAGCFGGGESGGDGASLPSVVVPSSVKVSINQASTEVVGSCNFTAPSDPVATLDFEYRIIFSETIDPSTFNTTDITNFGTGGEIALTWLIENCGDDKNFKLVATSVSGDGTIVPGLAAGVVQTADAKNNVASTSTDNSVRFDVSSPSVTINQATTETVGSCRFIATLDPTGTVGFNYRIRFSEAINAATLTVADISNGGTGGGTTLSWSLDNCGDDKNFKLTTATIVGYGTITPFIADNRVQDIVGNNNTLSTATDNSVNFIFTGWYQEAYIKAINNDASDWFGKSVSLSGDLLAVGANTEDSGQTTITNGTSASADNSKSNSGAVYVYRRTGANWQQEAYIKSSNNDAGDEFGRGVVLSGTTLAVYALGEASDQTTITNGPSASSNNSQGYSGAVYVYKRTGASWQQEAYIKAFNNLFGYMFGKSISLSGETLAVGASGEDSNQTTITNGTGASWNSLNPDSGAVYVYKRTGASWQHEAYIKSSNNDARDEFGSSVSLSEDILAVGAPGEDSNEITITNGATASTDNSHSGSGAVYVYKRKGVNWWPEAYIKAANSEASDNFGISISLSGNTLAVGASGEDSNQATITNGATASTDNSHSGSGAVYVYKRTDAGWRQEAYIKAANNGGADEFGKSISLSGNTLVVGAYYEDSSQTTITNGETASSENSMSNSGAVYVYKRTGANWTQEAYIKAANADADDNFGEMVSLSGDAIAVSAPKESSNQTTITNGASASSNNLNVESGAVFVYRNDARLFEPSHFGSSSKSTNIITLSWGRAGELAAGYKIAYSVGPVPPADCNSGTVVDVGNVLTATINSLIQGTSYSFRICSYDSVGTLSGGHVETVTTNTASPEIQSLVATADSVSTITLSWVNGGGGTAGFKIAYKAGTVSPVDCRSGTTIDAGSATSYQVTGLNISTYYGFLVCSYDSSGNLSLGYSVSARTRSAPEVTGLNITSLSTSVARVSWASGGGVTTGFRLAWNLGNTFPDNCNSGTQLNVGTATSYNIMGLGAGDQVSVRVCSYRVAGVDSSDGVTARGSTLASGWNQEAYIKAVNNSAGDNFGEFVSLSGNTLAVGAPLEASNQSTITNGTTASSDNSSPASGAVYVYKRVGSNWVQEAYIKAVNGDIGDKFGARVSLSRDTLAVGARGEASNQVTITNGATASEDDSNSTTGAVYVYKRVGASWAQEAYIKASNSGYADNFGTSISLSGNTLVVGAIGESSNQTTITNGTTANANNSSSNSGAVYVYKRTGVNWQQEAYIKAANNDSGDQYGYVVSLSQNTLVVGTGWEDSNQTTITNGTGASADNSKMSSGAVYVYKRTGENWQQEAYIKSVNSDMGDFFGFDVSLSGDTLAVGATAESSNQTTITNGATASTNNVNTGSGAVYVYKRTGVNWQQEAYVKAANSGAADLFGTSVALSGETLVVGAVGEDSNQTTITNGAAASTDNSLLSSGAVYVYKRTGVNWQQEAYIKPVNNGFEDFFGWSVSVSGDSIAVGSRREDSAQTTITSGATASEDNSSLESGAVYVYRNNGRLFDVHEIFGVSDSNSVTLSWHKSGGAAIEYIYAYQAGVTSPANCSLGTVVNVGNTDSDVIAGLTPSTTYSFRVCASDGTDTSSGSTITITTQP